MNDTLEGTVLGDMAQLEQTLTEDTTGDRARSMLTYFQNAAASSDAMLQKALPDAERQLVSQLSEGFRAAQRIVRHVWETLHGSALAA